MSYQATLDITPSQPNTVSAIYDNSNISFAPLDVAFNQSSGMYDFKRRLIQNSPANLPKEEDKLDHNVDEIVDNLYQEPAPTVEHSSQPSESCEQCSNFSSTKKFKGMDLLKIVLFLAVIFILIYLGIWLYRNQNKPHKVTVPEIDIASVTTPYSNYLRNMNKLMHIRSDKTMI